MKILEKVGIYIYIFLNAYDLFLISHLPFLHRIYAGLLPENEIENYDSRIIDEKTIFDHIHEKAKSFPEIGSKSFQSPSSEPLILNKKRLSEIFLDHQNEDVIEEAHEHSFSQAGLISTVSDSIVTEQSKYDFNEYTLLDEKIGASFTKFSQKSSS